MKKQLMDYFVANDRETSFRKVMIYYTFFWCIISVAIFVTFYFAGKGFIWKEDGMHAYIPSLAYGAHYLRDFIKELFHGQISFRLFDFNYGMGMDSYKLILGMFTSPLNLLAVFFPMSKVEIAYNIIIMLQFYLCGMSFLCYCRHMECKTWNALAGAIVYCFSGYALRIGIKHPQFIMPMILLPLLCLYLDKSLKDRRFSLKLVIVVAFSMANSYYFTFMQTIVLALYGILRYYDLYKDDKERRFLTIFLKLAGAYSLGVALAAFSYMTEIYKFFNSERTGSVVATDSMVLYEPLYYKKILTYFIGPSKSPGYWTMLDFSSIVLIAVVYLLIQKGKKYRAVKIAMLLGIGFLLLPISAYVFSGFNSINNRWTFIFAFLMAFIVAIVMDKLANLKDREIKLLMMVVLLYGAFVILTDEIRNVFSLTAVILLLVVFVFLIYCKLYPLKRIPFGFVMFLIIGGTIILNARYLYDIGKYTNQYVESGKAVNAILDNPLRLLRRVEDDDFYRVEHKDGSQATANASLLLQYNGVSQFNNVNSSRYLNYLEGLNCAGMKDIVLNYNLDGRTALDALACVKYYGTSVKDKSSIPYGYSLVEKNKKYALYENQNTLPIGYTYDSYLSRKEYDRLSDLEKQQAMLQSAVLEEPEETLTKKAVSELQFTNKELEIQDIKLKNVILTEDEIKVKKNNGSIKFTINTENESETYIRIADLVSQNPNYLAKIVINNGSITKSSYLEGDNILYKPNRSDLLINMGNCGDGTTEITITFQKKGTFSYSGIEAWSQSMEHYEGQINALKSEALSNVQMRTNTVKGTLMVSKDKLLCFAIPYSAGWKLYIDGVEEKLQAVNGMYMGAVVRQGAHEVYLVYTPPWLKIGIVISGIALLVVVLLYIIRLKKETIKRVNQYERNGKYESCYSSRRFWN